MGARRSSRHTVLPGTGFGNDARLAHAFRQKRLADGIVDLVRAGVIQILSLQIDSGPAATLRQTLRKIQRAGPANVMSKQALQFVGESRVSLGASIFGRELLESVHQRFGDKSSPKFAKSPILVRNVGY
jgi:hypothetical protein